MDIVLDIKRNIRRKLNISPILENELLSKYDSIIPFGNIFIVKKDNKYGFINNLGNLLSDIKYESIYILKNGYCLVRLEGKNGCIDQNGNMVIELKYSPYFEFSEGLASISENNFGYRRKYGPHHNRETLVIDEQGNELFQVVAGHVEPFKNGMAITYNVYEKYNDKFNDRFDDRHAYSSSKYITYNRYGLIDKLGNVILEPDYKSVVQITDNLFQVSSYGKDFVIDKKGNKVLENCARKIANNLLRVYVPLWEYNLVDELGQKVSEYTYSEIEEFSEGLARVKRGSNWGYIDTTGKEVIKPIYEEVTDFKDGYAVVKKNDMYAIIDIFSKKEITEFKYPNLSLQENGIAISKFGYLNQGFIKITNEGIIEKNYDWVSDFKEGLSIVIKDNKYGFVDKDLNEVTGLIYDELRDFKNGLALARINCNYFLINKKGKKVVDLIDSIGYEVWDNGSSLFLKVPTKRNQNYTYSEFDFYIINKEDDSIIRIEYEVIDIINIVNENFIKIKKEGSLALINKKGHIISEGMVEDSFHEKNFYDRFIYEEREINFDFDKDISYELEIQIGDKKIIKSFNTSDEQNKYYEIIKNQFEEEYNNLKQKILIKS